jgi:hypothetical protein
MTEGNIFMEKRAHSRFLVRIPVTYRLLDEKHKNKAVEKIGEESGQAHSMDSSLGGMYIVSEKALKSGDHLKLTINLPEPGAHLTLLTDVVWADGKGAGLRFLAMKEEEVKILETFLKKIQKS